MKNIVQISTLILASYPKTPEQPLIHSTTLFGGQRLKVKLTRGEPVKFGMRPSLIVELDTMANPGFRIPGELTYLSNDYGTVGSINEVYHNTYESMADARQALKSYLEFYNLSRKYQALKATPDQVYYDSIRLPEAGGCRGKQFPGELSKNGTHFYFQVSVMRSLRVTREHRDQSHRNLRGWYDYVCSHQLHKVGRSGLGEIDVIFKGLPL